jgi:hypothetical protein
MNSSIVEVMNAKENHTANDKFIDGYFNFYRLLIELKKTFPLLTKYADEQIEQFVTQSHKRSKDTVPNLGDWIILLLVSDKWTWVNVAKAFMEECDTRNVFWYVKGNYSSPAKFPALVDTKIRIGRVKQVFDATPISRHLVCFQVKFLQDAVSLNLDEYDKSYGQTPPEMKAMLKKSYKDIVSIVDWYGHYTWCGVPYISDEIRCDELIEAVELSNEKGYTNPQKKFR